MALSCAGTPEFLIRIPTVLVADHAIFRYARSGHVEGVRWLLASRQSTPFDITSNWGQSALRFAVSYNRLGVYGLLLAKKADPYFADKTHFQEDQTQLRELFSNTNMLDQRGFTRLHKTVLGLLQLGLASELEQSSQLAIDKTDMAGRTLLSWATTGGDHSTVQVLLKYGANFHMASLNGSTPLHWAVQSSSLTAVRLLLGAGAEVHKPNNKGYAPLHFAAPKRSDPETLELLLRFGANPDAQTHHGDTPIMNAARANHYKNFAFLMKNGASLNL
ncbi:ankyrin repeat-containing domain protein [Lasiosphaeria ovina]|uniref:Ankyrin repeat-containing domain protein n=1 Tax=Lasiosphaeria ovina TaxID=92902 RepID=A0AAE0K7R2_9PEZI|nr:ankyrin repeat-containing domain protein [Lasiosphaeria ovina]